MKKVLFVISNLESGGVQNSLISLLSFINPEEYDVSVMCFQHTGIFLCKLPSWVRLLDEQPSWFPIIKSIKYYIKRCSFISAIRRAMHSIYNKIDKRTNLAFVRSWKVIKPTMIGAPGQYDVAIAYGDGYPEYYVCDCVQSKYKIGWNHIDYEMSDYNKEMDAKYINKLDKIVVISELCKSVYEKCIEGSIGKTYLIENIVSRQLLMRKSLEDYPTPEVDSCTAKIKMLSIGRLTPQKGYDLLIPAMKDVISKGYDVELFIIGVGEDEKTIVNLISQYHLETVVHLLHEKENPYVYLKKCDIYIQPSRFEGKAIALEEAKLMCLPIIVTEYPTVGNQITDGVNGLVVELSSDSISKGVIYLIENPKIRMEYIDYLNGHDTSNDREVIGRFNDMIEGLN